MSGQGANKSHVETQKTALLSHYQNVFSHPEGHFAPLLPRPFNLSTLNYYTGSNVIVLQHHFITTMQAHPAYATFKQIKNIGGRVKAGEKAAAYIKSYDVIKEQNKKDKMYVKWAAVFHHSQAIFENNSLTAVDKNLEEMRKTDIANRSPHWINIITKKRNIKPNSLLGLAIKRFLEISQMYDIGNVKALLPADMLEHLWPAHGIDLCDDLLAKSGVVLDRLQWSTPETYYNACFLEVAKSKKYDNPLSTLIEVVKMCQQCNIPFYVPLHGDTTKTLGHFRNLSTQKQLDALSSAMSASN